MSTIYGDKLPGALKKQQALIWLSGDDPLLMQEAADSVRAHYRQLGFSQRDIFHVDAGFDWGQFRHSTGNLSLFADKRIIELRLTSPKITVAKRGAAQEDASSNDADSPVGDGTGDDSGDSSGGPNSSDSTDSSTSASANANQEGKAALNDYLDSADPAANADFLVLMLSPRLDAPTLKTKWFKAIESRALVVRIWPVPREKLGGWLQQRLRQSGMEADQDALALLMDKVEGNLLAAVQEIEKIKLMVGHPSANANKADDTGAASTDKAAAPIRVDGKMVMQAVADNARFSAYSTIDAALLGDAARAQRMLNGLQAEGVFPLMVLGAIVYQLRSLLPMLEKREQGQPIPGIIKSARVWADRQKAVAAALKRLHPKQVWTMLEHARLIDQSVKGMANANPWTELSRLLLHLSNTPTATTRAT